MGGCVRRPAGPGSLRPGLPAGRTSACGPWTPPPRILPFWPRSSGRRGGGGGWKHRRAPRTRTPESAARVRCPIERERHGIEACPSAPGGRSRGARRRGRGGLGGAPGSPAALRRPLGGSPGARGGRCPASGGGGRACFQASSPSGRMGLGHLSAAMAGSESPAGGRGGVLRAGGGASNPPVPPAPAPSPSPGARAGLASTAIPGGGTRARAGGATRRLPPAAHGRGGRCQALRGVYCRLWGGRGAGAARRRAPAAGGPWLPPPLPNQNSEGVFSL